MTSFKAEKYNPDTDPHYPKVGSLIDSDTKRITKVQHIEAGALLKMMRENKFPDDVEHCVIFDNPDRPFLKYFVWYEDVVINHSNNS